HQQPVPFGALAVEQGDLFGIFAHAHKIESKIGFVTLLLEIKGGEGATDQVCQDSSDDGVNERGPEQVPGDHQGRAEKMQGGASGQIPENYRKGAERYDRVQKTQPDWQDSDSRCAGIDEFPDVLGNALIRVVGGISAQLHTIVIGVGQPSIQVGLREPAPPADLQPLIEIKLINRKHDEDRGEYAKVAELIDEGVPIPVLQRIVKGVVPGIEEYVDSNDRQFDRNHRCQQNSARPAILGKEIRAGNSPHDSERREHAS